jgi:succinate dehydrogenase / fumarate reductase cytochrome b subunit
MAQVTQTARSQANRTRGADATPVNTSPSAKRGWLAQFYASAVGKKWVMAVSGLAMWLFVLGHMIGNLKLYLPADEKTGEAAIDHYAKFLRRLAYPLAPEGAVLWVLRIGLIVMLLLHVHAAITLTAMNRRARPTRYQSKRDYLAADFAGRSMRITGIVVFAYLVFHLFDLTFTGTGQTFVHEAVRHNLIGSLERPWVAAIYIVGNVALCLHLFHGAWSMFQSMGINNPRWNGVRRGVATGMALVVSIPNVLFPILIATKIVKL